MGMRTEQYEEGAIENKDQERTPRNLIYGYLNLKIQKNIQESKSGNLPESIEKRSRENRGKI